MAYRMGSKLPWRASCRAPARYCLATSQPASNGWRSIFVFPLRCSIASPMASLSMLRVSSRIIEIAARGVISCGSCPLMALKFRGDGCEVDGNGRYSPFPAGRPANAAHTDWRRKRCAPMSLRRTVGYPENRFRGWHLPLVHVRGAAVGDERFGSPPFQSHQRVKLSPLQ